MNRSNAVISLIIIVGLCGLVIVMAWQKDKPIEITEKTIVRTVEVPRHILSREEINAAIRDRIERGRADQVLEITAGICPDPGLSHLITCFALIYKIPVPLLFSIVQVESSYNPGAVSPAGAVGLMQLLPSTFKGYTREQLLDPQVNLRLGCEHLCKLKKRYGSWGIAVIRYNGRFEKGADEYLVKVMELEREYERRFNENL